MTSPADTNPPTLAALRSLEHDMANGVEPDPDALIDETDGPEPEPDPDVEPEAEESEQESSDPGPEPEPEAQPPVEAPAPWVPAIQAVTDQIAQLVALQAQQTQQAQYAQYLQQQAQMQSQQARLQSDEYRAERMMEARLDPTEPVHVLLYDLHSRLEAQAQEHAQTKQQLAYFYNQAREVSSTHQADAELSAALSGYNVPDDTRSFLASHVAAAMRSGQSARDAAHSVVSGVRGLLESTKKAAPAAPKPNPEGLKAVARIGRGTGRAPDIGKKTPTTRTDILASLRSMEAGRRR